MLEYDTPVINSRADPDAKATVIFHSTKESSHIATDMLQVKQERVMSEQTQIFASLP